MLLLAGGICSLWLSLAEVHACVLTCFKDVFGTLLKIFINFLFLEILGDKLVSVCQIEKTSLHISTSGAESGKR